METCTSCKAMHEQWNMYLMHLPVLMQELKKCSEIARHQGNVDLANYYEARAEGVKIANDAVNICGDYVNEKAAERVRKEAEKKGAENAEKMGITT